MERGSIIGELSRLVVVTPVIVQIAIPVAVDFAAVCFDGHSLSMPTLRKCLARFSVKGDLLVWRINAIYSPFNSKKLDINTWNRTPR